MSGSTAPWRAYWSALDSPQHRNDSEEWYRLSAGELLLHLPPGRSDALELGCGSGELYPYLRDRFARYVGTDFSGAMLARFRERHPEAALLCADATALPLSGQYGVVFSNGVCQYLDEEALRRNLSEVARLLAPGGIYLVANVPDHELRWKYYAGALRSDRAPARGRLLRAALRTALGRPDRGIGNWYSRRRLAEIAAEVGFGARTFSSATYEYRFHAVLRGQ